MRAAVILCALILAAGCMTESAIRHERQRVFAGQVARAIATDPKAQAAITGLMWYARAGEWVTANPAAAGGFLSGVVALVAGGVQGRRKFIAAMIGRKAAKP